jgi:tRNA threonylcarbamoyladenosine biosynthesis protein TsaE
MKHQQITLSSESATKQWASQLAQQLQAPLLLTLSGPLGAGKTTFVRGMLQALGYSGAVKSPSYTLVECYHLDAPIYHFDFYRIDDEAELEFIGLRDYFAQQAIVLVEWPERARGFLPSRDLAITFQMPSPHQRTINLTAYSALGAVILDQLS